MDNLLITFVLDETGSMEEIRDDTIGGFNTYIEGLQKDYAAHPEASVAFSLVKFDSNRVEKVYVNESIDKVVRLSRETYKPGAMTPLIDASVKAIRATEEALKSKTDPCNVLVVIQTDGQENASREFKLEDLQDLVKEKTAKGWQFVFLGAGFDAFGTAHDIGIPMANTLSYNTATSPQTFATVLDNTSAYRVSGRGSSLGFSVAQRTASVDVFFDKYVPGTAAAMPPVVKVAVPIVEDFDLSK